MAIGSGVLLPGVAENPTFPILGALAYTTGLGYRPTCDYKQNMVRSEEVFTEAEAQRTMTKTIMRKNGLKNLLVSGWTERRSARGARE